MATPKQVTIKDRVVSLIDETIAVFAPRMAMQRKKDRHFLSQFNYDAARPGRLRSQATLNGNASPETPTINYDRIRLIWEARDLEQNFPFVKKLMLLFVQYVLGDFRIKSKATDPNDRKIIDDHWKFFSENCDVTGRHNFIDISELLLMSVVRDGDMLPVWHGDGSELLQVELVEADCVGFPYEASFDNGYLSGVYYDKNSKFVTGYRVYQRDFISNTYTNPVDVPASRATLIAPMTRSAGLRCPTQFAAAIETLRDIQETLENERIGVKWATSTAGVVQQMGGDGNADTDLYPDPFSQNAGVPENRSMLMSAEPGKVKYLAPGEEYKSFDYDRPSASFNGFLCTLYREVCNALNIPYGFAYEPTANGVAARLESAQAQRTFSRWQRLMRDRWIKPSWNRAMQNGLMTGQLDGLSAQGKKELSLMKIIWPSHPTVDVGRESTANVNEYNANLKAGETISEERGDDYDEMLDQLQYEDKQKRDKLGLAEAVINNFGPKGIDGLMTLITSVSSGQIPPENGRTMLQGVFGLSEEEALKMIPLTFKVQPPPVPPGKGGAMSVKPPIAGPSNPNPPNDSIDLKPAGKPDGATLNSIHKNGSSLVNHDPRMS